MASPGGGLHCLLIFAVFSSGQDAYSHWAMVDDQPQPLMAMAGMD
jgi:hypothetical protein